MKSLYLNASRVANAIGLCNFEELDTIIAGVLQNARHAIDLPKEDEISNQGCTNLIKALAPPHKRAKIVHDIEQNHTPPSAAVDAVIRERVAAACDPLTTGQQDANRIKAETIRAAKLANLSPADHQAVVQMCNTHVHTSRGIRGECKILNDLPGQKVIARNDKMYYHTFKFPNISLRVGGKIDGYDAENACIIEAKQRQYKFLGIRQYEKVQLELYMRMLSVTQAHLVESFDGEMKRHTYTHDPELWRAISDKLEIFADQCLQTARNAPCSSIECQLCSKERRVEVSEGLRGVQQHTAGMSASV